ncbi:DsbA family protein [Aerococcaceae bacterium DSM 111021]|nr:DsbA family protein [Aerococcaceae bacterium DSM 111021]
MEIEFFHNSVCSHCYIQSRRLQKILKEFPEAKVIHRSFPLNVKNNHPKKLVTVSEREDTISKWKRANRVDEEKRFNVEALEAGDDFVKPTSYLAERAIKATSKVSDETAQWEFSDAIQQAYFEDLEDISDIAVLERIVTQLGINLFEWRKAFEDTTLDEEINADFALAESYGLDYIPALVVNGEKIIKGALRPQLVKEKLKEIN